MSQKRRLDNEVFRRGLVISRSQAENYIKLGKVFVNGKTVTKPGFFVDEQADIKLAQNEQYVSRAGLKLAGAAQTLGLNFANKTVLDVGSSTGGFTDYALKNGAKKVIAVDVGTSQLHSSLLGNSKIELHEQTNILDVRRSTIDNSESDKNASHSTVHGLSSTVYITEVPDIIVIDVSFVSLRDILPHIAKYLAGKSTLIVAMLKPQFEAGVNQKHKGVIKNAAMRRQILKDFETWAKNYFVINAKADSEVSGQKGNVERFYLLKKL